MTPHVWPLSLPAQVLHLNEWMRQQLTMTCSEVQHVSGPQEAFCVCFSSLTTNCVCFSFIRSKAQRSLCRDQTTQVQADFTRCGRGWQNFQCWEMMSGRAEKHWRAVMTYCLTLTNRMTAWCDVTMWTWRGRWRDASLSCGSKTPEGRPRQSQKRKTLLRGSGGASATQWVTCLLTTLAALAVIDIFLSRLPDDEWTM